MDIAENGPLLAFWLLYLAALIWVGRWAYSRWDEED